jgi:hypothetical protein
MRERERERERERKQKKKREREKVEQKDFLSVFPSLFFCASFRLSFTILISFFPYCIPERKCRRITEKAKDNERKERREKRGERH